MLTTIVARAGVSVLSIEDGLTLFDRALSLNPAHTLPVTLDLPALRGRADAGDLPAIFRGLVRAATSRATAASGVESASGGVSALLRSLIGAGAAEQTQALLALVRGHLATVLGHADANEVEVDRPFIELGIDSLSSVELRNRLNAATGLR